MGYRHSSNDSRFDSTQALDWSNITTLLLSNWLHLWCREMRGRHRSVQA